MEQVQDEDFEIVSKVSSTLEPLYERTEDDPWVGSPFEWMLKVPSRSKGAIGEKLVEEWATQRGFKVSRTGTSEADRIINGHAIEIKLSTLWANGGFKFQQIRNQAYDHCLCIGISPFEIHAWLLPKELLLEKVIGHMGQHTGASGADTAWLNFDKSEPYSWMKPYGDRLENVANLLGKMD